MTTAPLSAAQLEKAREYQSLILQQFAVIGQRAVANALDVSDSTVSRIKTEQVESISLLLVALELKVAPEEWKLTCPQYLRAIETLAARGIGHEKP